jgi:hypothetical protein
MPIVRRLVMFRRRSDTRALRSTDLRPIEPDLAVYTAERFVRRAWTLELERRRAREEFALQIERGNCEAAVEFFATAQRDGDPEQISAAHTELLQALDAVRAAVAARDQARRTLRKQLRLLTRKPKMFTAATGAGRQCPRTSTVPAPEIAAPDLHHAPRRSTPVDLRSRIRRPRALLHLMRRWTGALE